MSKRFTDTQIWEKEWFMKLKPKHKCLWRYLTERCDQAGVWDPNWQLASIYIGEPVTEKDLQQFNEQLETLANGKVFIRDFINFQYGRLSENSPAHKPVFKAIEKNNLSDRVFNRVAPTLQEKEKEMEEEKEILSKKAEIENSIFADQVFIGEMKRMHKGKDLKNAFDQCWMYHMEKPSPPTEVWQWRQKFGTWLTKYQPEQKQEKNRAKLH